MLRCTYRLSETRVVIAQAKVERLPDSGDHVTVNQQQYVVDRVRREGVVATVSVHPLA